MVKECHHPEPSSSAGSLSAAPAAPESVPFHLAGSNYLGVLASFAVMKHSATALAIDESEKDSHRERLLEIRKGGFAPTVPPECGNKEAH